MHNLSSNTALVPLAAGIDSLYVSYYLDGLGIDWEKLAFEKERLTHDRDRDYAELKLGDEDFALHRGAGRPYSYRLSNRAFDVRTGKRIQPSCHVRFTSEALWLEGPDKVTERFKSWFKRLGATEISAEVVARVDAAFDFNLPVVDFDYTNFLSQAEKDARWNQNRIAQSYQFGITDVVWRIYDKVAEIAQQSDKHWFFDIWGRDSEVWRVEAQIRGERLRIHGVHTVPQLLAHLPDVIRSLAKRHTSLRVKTKDSNASRWPLHPVWKGLLANADRVSKGPPANLASDQYRAEYVLQLQARSLYGMLKSIAATIKLEKPKAPVIALDKLVDRLPHVLEPLHSKELWEADIVERAQRKRLGL